MELVPELVCVRCDEKAAVELGVDTGEEVEGVDEEDDELVADSVGVTTGVGDSIRSSKAGKRFPREKLVA